MSRLQIVALAWVAFVIGLVAIHVLFPQRSGVVALTQVFEPYVVLTGLVAAVFLAITGPNVARAATAALLIVAVARYGPSWISFPAAAPSGSTAFSAASWNMELGENAGERVITGIGQTQADVVGVLEVQPDAADAIGASQGLSERYPAKILKPDSGSLGLALLSRSPIVEQGYSIDPPYIRAIVQPPEPNASPIAVFVVHSLPAKFVTVAGVTVALDTSKRDSDIALIRSKVDSELARGHAVVLLGDINTTDREPAYAELSAGLRDSHLDACGSTTSSCPRSSSRSPPRSTAACPAITAESTRPLRTRRRPRAG